MSWKQLIPGWLTLKAVLIIAGSGGLLLTAHTCHRQIVLDEVQTAVSNKETEVTNKLHKEYQTVLEDYNTQLKEKDALLATLAKRVNTHTKEIEIRHVGASNELKEVGNLDLDSRIDRSVETAIWTIQSSYGRRVDNNNQSTDDR